MGAAWTFTSAQSPMGWGSGASTASARRFPSRAAFFMVGSPWWRSIRPPRAGGPAVGLLALAGVRSGGDAGTTRRLPVGGDWRQETGALGGSTVYHGVIFGQRQRE